MRASVQYHFQISYADPVRAMNQVLRLTPRGFDGQEIKDWRVDVLPDARMRRNEDAFGNIVHSCSHDGPLEQLSVMAEGDIETNDTAGVVRGLPEKLPLDVYLRHTAATLADKELLAFTQDALSCETDPLGRMHVLNDALHEACAFAPGEGETPRPAREAFASRAGSARELAQVFVAAARGVDVPARLISGFFLGTEGVGAGGAHHAWAEVFVEPIGWIGFDPAFGCCPRDEYLRIALGLDFAGAAPRRSAVFGYAREASIAVLKVDVSRQASWQGQQ